MATQNIKRALFALLILAVANCSSRRGGELEFDPIPPQVDRGNQPMYDCRAVSATEFPISPRQGSGIKPLNITLQVALYDSNEEQVSDGGDPIFISSKVRAVSRDGASLISGLGQQAVMQQVTLSVNQARIYEFRVGLSKANSNDILAACEFSIEVAAAEEEVPPSVRLISENGRTFENVPYGTSLEMGWISTGVDECVITANDVPLRDMLGQIVKVTSGVFSTGVLTVPSVVYKATCTAPAGVTSPPPAIVGVSVRPLPALQLLVNGSPNPAQLPPGGATIPVSWNSTDAATCSLKANDVELNPNGTVFGSKQILVNRTTVFELECKDAAIPPHRVRRDIEIKVAAPLVPTATLTAQARSVAPGAATTLNWTTRDVSSCSLKRGKPDSSDLVEISTWKNATNFSTGAIHTPTRFKLFCTGLGGQKNAEVVVGIYKAANIKETYLPQNMCASGHCSGGHYPGSRDTGFGPVLMENLWPGMKLTYNSMSGISIYRVHGGNAYSQPCPEGIAVQFKDFQGNVVPIPGYSYGLLPVAALASGYQIPTNAVSVWGSFPDSAYFDNGGRRSHHSYTNGCHFTLETYQ